MVDALCSGRSVRKDVLVRIQSWAQAPNTKSPRIANGDVGAWVSPSQDNRITVCNPVIHLPIIDFPFENLAFSYIVK